MLLHLPTFNATLNPCPVSPATFTPHAKGHFCGSCQRVVQDFSQSENPLADLAAARTASPDGRVCGSFRREQVVTPTLSRRLRWFVMALVLVMGQGLTAREALAQVRRPVPHKTTTPHKKHAQVVRKQSAQQPMEVVETFSTIGELPLPEYQEQLDSERFIKPDSTSVFTYVEQMPELPDGGGILAVVAYIQKRVKRPTDVSEEGRIFVSFIVGNNGQVREAKVIKGLHPLLDAETIRVIQALPVFTPGRQNGQPVAVSLTLPITFRLNVSPSTAPLPTRRP